MVGLACTSVTGYTCDHHIDYETIEELILPMLRHINNTHDPDFVPRCNDDLLAEYTHYTDTIAKLLA